MKGTNISNDKINRAQMLKTIFDDSPKHTEEQRFVQRVYCRMELKRLGRTPQILAPADGTVARMAAARTRFMERLEALA